MEQEMWYINQLLSDSLFKKNNLYCLYNLKIVFKEALKQD